MFSSSFLKQELLSFAQCYSVRSCSASHSVILSGAAQLRTVLFCQELLSFAQCYSVRNCQASHCVILSSIACFYLLLTLTCFQGHLLEFKRKPEQIVFLLFECQLSEQLLLCVCVCVCVLVLKQVQRKEVYFYFLNA